MLIPIKQANSCSQKLKVSIKATLENCTDLRVSQVSPLSPRPSTDGLSAHRG